MSIFFVNETLVPKSTTYGHPRSLHLDLPIFADVLAAARRGVRVRVLIDQLSALKHVDNLAALAGAHRNFELRIYNPVLGRAPINYPQYVLAAACCWRRLNQRMHSKLLLVDDIGGITGGRHHQHHSYGWDPVTNFQNHKT